MLRYMAIGALAAAVLLGGSAIGGAVERAQAQVISCNSWQGNNWACSENHFNQTPATSPDAMTVPNPAPQMAASTNQTAQQVDSQAGPRADTDSQAQE